jgi:hypothetical protein
MLTHDVLETQMTLELPAREMLAFFNFSWIVANQQAANYNTQVNAGGIGQANFSTQSNANTIFVYQD